MNDMRPFFMELKRRGGTVKESTKTMIKKHGLRFDGFLHNYVCF